MNVLIRPANLTDIDSMINLLDQLFSIEADFKPDIPKQRAGLEMLIKEPNSCVLVAEFDEKIIGMLTAQIFISTAEGGKSAVLEDMVIDKEYRRQGIGNKLMNKAEQWALENKILRLQLLADKNNLPALDYYRKLNWSSTLLICLRKYPNSI